MADRGGGGGRGGETAGGRQGGGGGGGGGRGGSDRLAGCQEGGLMTGTLRLWRGRGERELGEENIGDADNMMGVTGSPFSLVHLHWTCTSCSQASHQNPPILSHGWENNDWGGGGGHEQWKEMRSQLGCVRTCFSGFKPDLN